MPPYPGNGVTDASCPLCGTILLPLPLGLQHYRKCPQCAWIALDKSHCLTPEKQKERYLQHDNRLDCGGYVSMFEAFIREAVEPFSATGEKLLDFGCGPKPVLADLLRNKGYRVDIHDRFFYPEEAVFSTKYSLITLTEVLEHLTDPVEVLGKLTGQLEGPGFLAIMTLFHPDQPESFAGWWYRRDPTHVAFYNLRTLRQLAKRLGMEVVHSDEKRIAVLKKK